MNGSPDPVEAAIGAAEKRAVQLKQWQVTIGSTGRPTLLALPVDVTEGEIAELAGWLLTTLLRSRRVEQQQAKTPRLVIARGRVPRM